MSQGRGAVIDDTAQGGSLAVFGLDLLIIYGLSAYGGQRSRPAAG